jgi:DNA-binding response OmpR family regulator
MVRKVLVLERAEELREARVEALANRGYEVMSASCHSDAIMHLSRQPDIIFLCDCAQECFPWACARLFKSVMSVPCVAVTTVGRKEEAMRAGADACVTDPLSLGMFVDAAVAGAAFRRAAGKGNGDTLVKSSEHLFPSLLVASRAPQPTARGNGGNGGSERASDGNGHGNGKNGGNGHGRGNGKNGGNGRSGKGKARAIGLELDETTYQARVNGKPLQITATEFRLLATLMRNAPRVMTSDEILNAVWGHEYLEDGSILRLYVHALRTKLHKVGGDRDWIKNVPRVGYAFIA